MVLPELFERKDLKKLLVCSDSSWCHDKGVGQIFHFLFAFAHRIGVYELGAVFGEDTWLLEKLRSDPDRLSLVFDDAAVDLPHDAGVPSAKD